MTGRLYGVGLGPGDPELVTVKAARLIGAADVVAFHAAQHGRSVARGLAEPYLRAGQVEELLVYPVTTGTTDHPGGYQGAIDEFYAAAAERLAAHLDAGRDVVVLAEGDPFFYGSYMHMHKRLAHRYPTEVVPGVTSVSGASAVLGRPLVERDEVLTVLPGTLPTEELAAWLETADSAAVMKLGRTFPAVRDAFAVAGVLDRAWYVERATTDRERVLPLADVDPETVPYFSLALLPSELTGPGNDAADLATPSSPAAEGVELRTPAGSVTVVGLGPGARWWTTPEAAGALAEADDLVGYGPTWTGCRPTRGRSSTPATTGSRPSARRRRWRWPARDAGSRWCPRVTRGCSRWRRRCSRWPRPTSPTSRSGCCPASPRRRPWRRRWAPRWGTTSASCRCRTCSSRGTSSSTGSGTPPPPTW